MMVQWRTETCHPNSHKANKVYEDTYIVVLDGLINLLFQLQLINIIIKCLNIPHSAKT